MNMKSEKRGDKHSRRTLARLNAIQATYQYASHEQSLQEVINEFLELRVGAEIEGEQYKDADKTFFKDLVIGADERAEEIDELIAGVLDKERTIGRLEQVMRACLRVAVYELLARIDNKAVVIISEHVGLARTFFSGKEPTFVNGVLDKIARDLRPSEFED
jgi:transcription antitermination protein NusB